MSNKQEMLYGLCMVALAMQLTAVSTENWSVKSGDSYLPHLPKGDHLDIAFGLWKGCGEGWGKVSRISGNVDVCVHLPIEGVKTFPKNSLYAARAFAVIGSVLIFMAMTCMMYMKNHKRCQLVMLMAGGMASIIASIIWAAEMLKVKVDDNGPTIKFNPGYSFYLNMVGGLVGLLAAAYYYYGK